MKPELILAIVAFAFVTSITPGPNNTMVLASGTNFGFVRTLPHLLGITIGFVFMLICVGFGLGEAFHAMPILAVLLQWGSVLYMLYLAYKVATTTYQEGNVTSSKPMSFLAAAAFQWINPKAWMIIIGAASTFLPSTSKSVFAVFVMGLTFALVNFPCISVWAVAGVGISKLLRKPVHYRIINVVLAILLVASVLVPMLQARK